MSDFSRIYKRVALRVPGAAKPIIDDAIRDAAIEFCKRSRLWRFDTTVSTIGDSEPLVGDTDSDVFEITSANFDGNDLDPVSISWLDDNTKDWRDETQTPRYFTQFEPNTIRLVPLADTAAVLKLSLYLCPSQTATTVPDWLSEKYHKALAAGAIADIAAIPAQEFTDPVISAYNQNIFDESLDSVMTQALKGQQRAKPTTKPKWY